MQEVWDANLEVMLWSNSQTTITLNFASSDLSG
jgi:hypothetical protein